VSLRLAVTTLLGRVRPRLARRSRGQMMVLFALSFLGITGAVGMAADMGLYIVEQQHLQTAADSAAVAAARYYVVYTGAGVSTQLAQATTAAQNYMDQYGYTTSNLTGPLSVTSPATRQVRVTATKTRNTMLIKLIGINQLTARATSTASADIKADIYAALDITASMDDTDIVNMQNGVTTFITGLGLDATNPAGPALGIGQFLGERCTRVTPAGAATDPNNAVWDVTFRNTNGSGGMNPDPAVTPANWIKRNNWVSTTGAATWCDPTTAPALYSGTTFSPPAFGTAPPIPGGANYTNPYYPGARTVSQLSINPTNATTAINSMNTDRTSDPTFNAWEPGTGTGCFQPMPVPRASPCTPTSPLDMYFGADTMTATSHTAGMVTAAYELNSNRTRFSQGQQNYRRVLIFQTDGTVCPTQVPFTAAQSEARAENIATQLKSTPTAFLGIEIFTIMFYTNDGVESCPNNQVSDHSPTPNTLFPNCGPSTTVLPPAGNRTPRDNYMIRMSSSARDGAGVLLNCDHYLPANRTDPNSLTNAYREILKRLAVGRVVS
jgi:Flp pilus assembly protein TadG